MTAAGVGAVAANLINNLPATLVGLGGTAHPGSGGVPDGMWGWLWGVNAGSLLLPWGTLATVLWWRVLRNEGVVVDFRRYARAVIPVALPSFLAGGAVLGITIAVR